MERNNTPAAGWSAQEIDAQLRFSGLGEAEYRQLQDDRDLYRSLVDPVATAFYERVLSVPELVEVIRQHTTVERLLRTFHEYWRSLTEDPIDARYVETRLAIGRRHDQVGLAPRWYLAAFGLVSSLVSEALTAKYRDDPNGLRRAEEAIGKRIRLDSQLAVDSYIDALLQRTRSIQDEVADVAGQIRRLAEENRMIALNAAIEAARAGEHGRTFAVVADEIRRLSERSADSARQIGQLLSRVEQ